MSKFNVKHLIATFVLISGLGSAGCSQDPPVPTRIPPVDSDLVSESYSAADTLLDQAPWLREQREPMLTASFVNINALENSSALGRMISEQMSSRFAQQGFTMIELKMRTNVFIKQNAGEFVLSREVQNLSKNYNAGAVVAGTYAVGRRSVYINARLIRAADSLILASYDYSLPLGPDTKALLASQ